MARVELTAGEAIKPNWCHGRPPSPTIDVESKMEGGFLGASHASFDRRKVLFRRSGRVGAGRGALGADGAWEIVSDGTRWGQRIYGAKGRVSRATRMIADSQMQSLSRGLLGGEGFFILKVSGKGTLLLNSFGAIHKIELKPDQEYIVDNSHLVAWSGTTSYNIERAASGWVASFTSGEGFVCRFRGPGVVYIQSRNPGGFGAWVRQFIPVSE
jgi:uncharacterized protein (AIM24 family)